MYERLWDAVWIHPQEVIDEGTQDVYWHTCCSHEELESSLHSVWHARHNSEEGASMRGCSVTCYDAMILSCRHSDLASYDERPLHHQPRRRAAGVGPDSCANMNC